MNKIIYALLLTLTSCVKTPEQHHVKVINKLMGQTTREISKDHPNITTVGYGGRMMGDIQTVYLHFYCLANVDINEARKIYIECVERIKEAINNNMEIKPYLHTYPFTIEETDITINFIDASGSFISQKDSIALVSFAKSQIYYCFYDTTLPFGGDFVDAHRESYEEALRIYQSELNRN